jgi:hypothetical protein
MSEARINRISNELGTGGPIVSGITTFSGLNYFVPPKGTTAERPSNCPSGSIRFNTDGAHLEYFDGLQWLEMEAFNNELGVSGALGNRGVFASGQAPAGSNVIQYVTISTTGNSLDFGDLSTSNVQQIASCASSTRGIFAGGALSPGARTNTIEFVTISITGNFTDFGDLTVAKDFFAGCSNSTRGIFAGGFSPTPAPATTFNIIDYITVASTGNAVNFGSLTTVRQEVHSCSNSTRGIIAGGYTAPSYVNIIEFITISTLGNSTDFGDLSTIRGSGASCSNSTRGIFAGGYNPNGDKIDFITIATLGNSTSFGTLTTPRNNLSACSSPTRGIFAGGNTPTATNIIEYVTILSAGNSIDFGDLLTAQARMGACSNGHGGL